MKDVVSPKQVARAIGVSESSLKRWCDQGLLPTIRTPGGHRRLPISGVLAYLRSQRQRLVAPELLGLPATSGSSKRVVARARDEMREALLAGSERPARGIVFDLWLAGQSLARIFDQVIAAAFAEIGAKWACHEADVYQERRACEIILRILHEVRLGLPQGDPKWTAVGGTVEGDHYLLPTTMAEIVLQEQGWSAHSVGASLPFASLVKVLRESRPRLFWLSVSHIESPAFPQEFATLKAAADQAGTALVVGGFALQGAVRQQIRYSALCESMQNLEDFAAALRRDSRGGGGSSDDTTADGRTVRKARRRRRTNET